MWGRGDSGEPPSPRQSQAVVTDPPYGLEFMGRAWDCRSGVAFDADTWAAVLRVLKPGAHMLCLAAPALCTA